MTTSFWQTVGMWDLNETQSEPKLKEKFIQGKNKLAKKESIPVEKVSEAYGYDGSRQEKRP
ncbi:hypothetical protein J7E73_24845 [Paenibacillus albidus]|uniref:hypothetical protein n=1 Tax=Paenibacillus albidus TaxID=2041023 RepID=UPI001BE83999|nr:hypothetical protein [Paenibacillus albidus]MBT2292296.1 hypothetical protein [Paenibacillus albidus]